jgi:carbon monoxide dehydrogenase subunit G
MPGASLDSVNGDEIKGRIKVKVGPISMTYAGTARFTERDAATGVMKLEATGKETRGAGTASATVRSELHGEGDETHVTVHTSLNVTGRPAQFGRGVMSEVSGKLIGIFAANLASMLTADNAAGSAAGADAAPAAGADASPAAGADAAPAAGADAGPAAGADAGPAGDLALPPAGDLALPVEELHLALRSHNSLRRDGIHTVGELAARTEQQLLAIDHIGPASVEEIRQKLAERGLALSTGAGSTAGSAASGTAASGIVAAGAAASPAGAAASPAGAAASPAGAAASPADSLSAGARPADASGPGTSANGHAAASRAAANGDSGKPAPATGPRPAAARPPDEDAIDLLSVAGLPVLKRAIPVLGGLLIAVAIALRIRLRRRRAAR